ncbi:MAG: hypothetical protein JSV26_03950 [bacterium]|nr:MAG: hypothetical protein JSV26_03950 [bacterium]
MPGLADRWIQATGGMPPEPGGMVAIAPDLSRNMQSLTPRVRFVDVFTAKRGYFLRAGGRRPI